MDADSGKKFSDLQKICFAIAALGIVIVALLCVIFFKDEQTSEKKMEELRLQVEAEPIRVYDTEEAQPEYAEAEPAVKAANPYSDLFEQNKDMAGWLVVDGTVIDYPVMQTMDDEEYYLERDFYGNQDKAGCLILDTDSSLDREGTTNLIIHGHNMKLGTMFGELDKYKDEDYYREHKYLEFYTRTEKREYEVIAVFYSQVFYQTDIVFKYYNFFEADDQEQFDYFYNNIKELSIYDTGVSAEPGDNFITLSTCAYQVEDGRFVVIAKETGRPEQYYLSASE